jgi:hypothetical protein
MPRRDGTLKAREFLFFVEDLALQAIPANFPAPERRLMWTILQLHYGEPTIHFEIQPRPATGSIELGLHFEGQPEANEANAVLIAGHAHHLRATLGPEWELEEWTASWRRLHRTYPFTSLNGALGREVAADFTNLILTLTPILAEARLLPSLPPSTPLTSPFYTPHV